MVRADVGWGNTSNRPIGSQLDPAIEETFVNAITMSAQLSQVGFFQCIIQRAS